MYLTDRQSLLRALFRLLDTDAGDGALIEHDPASAPLEGITMHLQQGAEDAQEYLIGAGSTWWHETSEPLTFGRATDNRQWAELPTDFRRMFSSPDRSALYDTNGRAWGVEISPELSRRSPSLNAYWIAGNRLWLPRRATPPVGLVMDYIRRIGSINDNENVDFPEDDRTLIVAWAALHAREEHWYTGGQPGMMKIDRNLQVKKRQAFKRARRTSAPRKVGTPLAAPHWALTAGGPR